MAYGVATGTVPTKIRASIALKIQNRELEGPVPSLAVIQNRAKVLSAKVSQRFMREEDMSQWSDAVILIGSSSILLQLSTTESLQSIADLNDWVSRNRLEKGKSESAYKARETTVQCFFAYLAVGLSVPGRVIAQ